VVKHFPVVRILDAVQLSLTGSCAAFSQHSEATVFVAGSCVDRVGGVGLGAVGSPPSDGCERTHGPRGPIPTARCVRTKEARSHPDRGSWFIRSQGLAKRLVRKGLIRLGEGPSRVDDGPSQSVSPCGLHDPAGGASHPRRGSPSPSPSGLGQCTTDGLTGQRPPVGIDR
jgi:hypothetical protein